MKVLTKYLTVLWMFWLLGCKSKSGTSTLSENEKVYRLALEAHDYRTATNALTAMATAEKPDSWVYDSLALYHFIYNQENTVKLRKFFMAVANKEQSTDLIELGNSILPHISSTEFYINKGLELNPKNEFLRILQLHCLQFHDDTSTPTRVAKLLDELEKDKSASAKFLSFQENIQSLKTPQEVVDMLKAEATETNPRANQTVYNFVAQEKIYDKLKYKTALRLMLYQLYKDKDNKIKVLDEIISTDPDYKVRATKEREAAIKFYSGK